MIKSESASARWARIIDEQRSSDLSIAEFCRRREVPPASFYAWRRCLRAGASPAFVELKVETPRIAALELLLPGDRRVLVRPGFDRDLLRELLAALEPPGEPT